MTINVDYTSRDFDGFKNSLLNYARENFPEWSPSSEGDFGVLLIELLSYIGDVNSYYVDRAQREAYLTTASQGDSVIQIAQMLGYVPHTGSPATGVVTVKNTTASEILIPADTRFQTSYVEDIDGPLIFERAVSTVLAPGETKDISLVEGETKRDETTGGAFLIGNGTGNVDQTIRLPHPNVYRETVELYVEGERWRSVPHMIDAEPDEKVFAVRTDAAGYTWIDFGDGLNGKAPAQGLAITAQYRVGFGSRGNIAMEKVTGLFKANLPGLSLVKNSNVADGGADPETLDQIRANAPRSFATQQRAVTEVDFENAALAVPGVTKAKALSSFWSSVVVYIIGADGNAPSADLRDDVFRDLSSRSLAGVSVTVGDPEFVNINVGSTENKVAIQAWPGYTNSSVKFAVEQQIKKLLSFVHADLGMRITVSMLYQAIMNVDGVRYVSIPLMVRDDAVQNGTSDIQLQAWEFPRLGDLEIDVTGGLG